ncbi:hypothetical protein [Marinibactrum halimedae]|uniref:Transposase family protein n=1 Tax=Marinibactrum halimedae TaxID=1444977 RepID=A0AA37TAE7_9GAMM|nr:hypothetical protein [Marinibactrum halimedae]MCD9461006.1 hypothetical protein [Marinibactrum halimedae]GLS27808.1 hypothetical protein GCM10007877_35270 [Marinibactrum halimedae]
MKIIHDQFEIIEDFLPTQRGNVKTPNIHLLSAVLHVAEHGCMKWSAFSGAERLSTSFTRYEKLDVIFRFFIKFALIVDRIISVNRP